MCVMSERVHAVFQEGLCCAGGTTPAAAGQWSQFESVCRLEPCVRAELQCEINILRLEQRVLWLERMRMEIHEISHERERSSL